MGECVFARAENRHVYDFRGERVEILFIFDFDEEESGSFSVLSEMPE